MSSRSEPASPASKSAAPRGVATLAPRPSQVLMGTSGKRKGFAHLLRCLLHTWRGCSSPGPCVQMSPLISERSGRGIRPRSPPCCRACDEARVQTAFLAKPEVTGAGARILPARPPCPRPRRTLVQPEPFRNHRRPCSGSGLQQLVLPQPVSPGPGRSPLGSPWSQQGSSETPVRAPVLHQVFPQPCGLPSHTHTDPGHPFPVSWGPWA